MAEGSTGNDGSPSTYRRFAAALFDVACARTGLGAVALTERLRGELLRSALSRQTVTAWRKGEQAATGSALFAALRLADMSMVEAYTIVFAHDPYLVSEVLPPAAGRDAAAADAARQRLAALTAGLEAYRRHSREV